jgi:ABC-2 type transport system permease protein
MITDSLTMLRRSLRHGLRYPLMLMSGLLTPIILLLMFVYVVGGVLGGRSEYLGYVAPSMLLLTACYGGGTTAVTVSVDLTEGIINRFRTMPIFRAAVLAGHVLGGVIRTLCAIALVLEVAVLMGFRPAASGAQWLAAIGLLTLLAFALTWLTIAPGSAARSPGGADTAALPLQLLPVLSSAFVPTGSMPPVLRWVAAHQPFTPIVDTLRGLLTGTPADHSGPLAVAWCTGMTIIGCGWALVAFHRRGATQ